MFKQPPQPGEIAFGIAGSSEGVESEANANNPPDRPVCDSVRKKIEQNPSRDHGDDGDSFRRGRSRHSEGDTSQDDPGKLNRVSRNDRKSAEDLPSQKGTCNVHKWLPCRNRHSRSKLWFL